jgi:predicted transcriptional regulator
LDSLLFSTVTTRLDGFLSKRRITTADVARATGYHRNHIGRVRKGQAEPTRECMAAILHYLRRRTGESVDVGDLFDFARRKAS